MKTRLRSRLLCLFFVFLGVYANTIGQVSQGGLLSATSMERTISNYYFAKPNELTIIVNVVGFVQRPGRYEISNTIDLINLMALAGGGTSDGALDDVKITRITEIDGRVRMKEIRVNLEEIAKLSTADLRLFPGDIIQVNKSGWAGFRDTFTIVVGAAIITTAVSQVIIATKQ